MVRISLISIIGTIVLILGGCNVLDVFSETEDNILGNVKESSWALETNSQSSKNNLSQVPNLMILAEPFTPARVLYLTYEGKRSAQVYQAFLGEGILAETVRVKATRPSDILELPNMKTHALSWIKLSGKTINWGKKRYYSSKFSPVYYRAAKVGSKESVCIFFNMPYDISRRDHFDRPKEAILGYFCLKSGGVDLIKVKSIFDGFSFSGKSAKSSVGQLFLEAKAINKQATTYYSKKVTYNTTNNTGLRNFPLNLNTRIDITDSVLKAD